MCVVLMNREKVRRSYIRNHERIIVRRKEIRMAARSDVVCCSKL